VISGLHRRSIPLCSENASAAPALDNDTPVDGRSLARNHPIRTAMSRTG
jgi:hypothetical protein